MKYLFVVILGFLFIRCNTKKDSKREHFPSNNYKYVSIDTAAYPVKSRVYVPIYSHIYMLSGERIINLAATLSIRHTTFTDSTYITKVDYYSSQGKLLKQYIDKALLLEPMHSVEFVVEEKEGEGGAGANFVVEYASAKEVADPLIQAVMIASYNTMGISFTTEGIKEQKR